MPAPKMLAVLPKPVLFGLYGAIGGFLGAFLFGELIMLVLEPKKAEAAPPPKPEPRLAVVASKDLQIYQGGVNKLFVQILRDEFDDPVTIHLDGLPTGITANDVIIPKGKDETEIELRAAFSANPSPSSDLKVVATAKPGGKVVTATSGFKLATLASPMPQADIMFVLDVTASMQNQIDGLKDGIGTFANDLYRAKVDARFGCVAFRDLTVPESPEFPQMQLLKFKGEVFTSDARVFSDEVAKLRAVGGGDIPESSFEALSEAASITEWRKSAIRTLILITDAPPKILVGQGQSKKTTIDSLRENKIEFLHLVVNPAEVPVYTEIQQGALGSGDDKGTIDRGKIFNLSTVARDKAAMTSRLLPEMTKAIVAAAESKRPDTKPELTKKPQEKPVLPTVGAVQSGETYNKSDSAQLVLAVGVWTGAIAALVCLFLVSGQHHYLRGTLPAVGGILAGLGGGFIAGVIGGAAGQGLFLLANIDNTILAAIFRIMGWTILGSLAGLGLSLFVPNLKLVYGLGGGAIGGAVGAIGYIAVAAVVGIVMEKLTDSDLGGKVGAGLGRLAGGLLLGLFIGLMVAVVEAAFRRAWLEVRYGPREMVTVNLGTEPVKVGGDASVSTVWARGAAPVELRYFIRNGKVICDDVPSRSESVVGDGDTREVGNVTVVVRTGSGKAPAATARPAPPPRPKAKAKPIPQPELQPLDLDDDPLPLPVSASPPPSVPPPAPARATPPPVPTAAAPARPPVPAAPPPRPTAPAAPPPRPAAPPAAAPAIKPVTRDPDACPSCGRKNPGRPGTRYCMVCDQTY